MKIEITGSPKILYEVKRKLDETPEKFSTDPVFKRTIGVLHEPLLVALVVALGGPVVVKEFVGFMKHFMTLKHIERMQTKELAVRIIENSNDNEYINALLSTLTKTNTAISDDELTKAGDARNPIPR